MCLLELDVISLCVTLRSHVRHLTHTPDLTSHTYHTLHTGQSGEIVRDVVRTLPLHPFFCTFDDGRTEASKYVNM